MVLDVREVVRRLQAGATDRAIARELGMARKTVAKYRERATEEGWIEGVMPSLEELEARVRALLPHSNLPRTPFKAEPYREQIEALRRGGVEIQAIFQRLRTAHGYTGSYPALHRYVRHLEGATPTGFVRLEVGPGEEAQVDFGRAGMLVDPASGQLRKAWTFVMTLSFSRHQYAAFVFDQSVRTWLRCHRQAFEYFGGVPKRVVIDNLKAAIVRAVWHDPVVQRSYRECAEYYGFLIAPCRPRMARHKGKVESGVRYVDRNFRAGRPPGELSAENAALREWVETVAGRRRHGTTKEQPLVRFRELERGALLPLPEAPYDLGVWKRAKLHPDCHVVVDGAYYSAPHRLIGERLWVRTNGQDVVIFHHYERLATHRWGPPGTRRTITDHYPPDKQAYLMATPTWCRGRAIAIGPSATAVVERLLAERPLDRLRSVQAILGLADRHGAARLEAACRRALHFDELGYRTLKRILDKGLEGEPLPETEPAPHSQQTYLFARSGSEIFH
jgi:transposase